MVALLDYSERRVPLVHLVSRQATFALFDACAIKWAVVGDGQAAHAG
jgi:hypothetical protein